MWPNILDIPKEQCTGLLRNLECQAYTNLIDAYRASGPLTDDKKSSLESVARILNISSERHKAEVRRAVNDELLTTISTRLCGQDPDYTWLKEGRRIIPVLPRAAPSTGLSSIAQRTAEDVSRLNISLPRPRVTKTAQPPHPLPKPEHLLAPAAPCPAPSEVHVPHQNGDTKPSLAKAVDTSDNGLVTLPSGTVVRVSAKTNSGTKTGRGGKRRRSNSVSKSIEVFPGGMAQMEAASVKFEADVLERSPPRKAPSVLGAGHGYARPLPSNSPLPDRQVVFPFDASSIKRGPGRPPGPASPKLAGVLHTLSGRGRPRMAGGVTRGRGSRPRGGVLITPRLATPQTIRAVSSPSPILLPHTSLSQPQPLMPGSPMVTSTRLALRPTSVSLASAFNGPRATTIQLKQDAASGLANPALQGLKVISHSTTKIVPKSATAVYMVPSMAGRPGVLPGSPGRIVTVNSGAHRMLTGGVAGAAGLPGVIKTVRAGGGPGKPSVIVLQKGAGLPSVSGGVALYRPARARVVSGTHVPVSAGGSNVLVLDMSKQTMVKSSVSNIVTSHATILSTHDHSSMNGDSAGGKASPDEQSSDTCSQESDHTDAENNSLSEENTEVQTATTISTDSLPHREETGKVTPIPTYDLSSEDNITNVIRSEVLENNQEPVQSNGQTTQE